MVKESRDMDLEVKKRNQLGTKLIIEKVSKIYFLREESKYDIIILKRNRLWELFVKKLYS